MDQIAYYVLTIPIEKNMIFTKKNYSHRFTFVFQAPQSLWDFFQLRSTCPVHLKIGTCSLNIMLNNNFNSLTPWDLQNPYNPRLNQKEALWATSKKIKNSNYQYYNILSAYEVKDETSTSSTYVSPVFYRIVRSRKILVKK
jgi:hypothetical protein